MKTTSKIISVILAVLMLMSILSASVFAADTNVKTTGGAVSYSFVVSTSTLIISCDEGTEIPDYDSDDNPAPWNIYTSTATKLIISEGITRIGDYAFSEFGILSKITLPNSLKTIGDNAFSYCTNLTSVNIPSGVIDIHPYAFDYSSSLASFTVDPMNQSFTSDNGVLYNKTKTTLWLYPVGKAGSSYNVPSSVTTIAENAFFDSKLYSVTLPQNLKFIKKYAFYDCQNLKNVNIPDKTEEIENCAFAYSSIESITVPDSVTYMGISVFEYCDMLKTARIGNKISYVAAYTFNYCTSLSSLTLGKKISFIEKYAFSSCTSLKEIRFPDAVKTINECAFYNCEKLKSVTLSKSLEELGDYVFENTAFKTVYLPKNVDKLGTYALGYYDDGIDDYPVNGFKIYCVKGTKAAAAAKSYKEQNGTAYSFVSIGSASLKAGKTKTLKATAGKVTGWKSSKTAVATVKKGKVTALKKGKATITATLYDGAKVTGTATVKTSPTIKVGGKAYKSSKTYSVNKGKTLTVKITGKASTVKNKYSSSKAKIAKVVSKTTATKVKIKGLKKGTAKITIKVNGVAFKIKVKVK